jgi:putative tricarboxylic transport membrane protein
MNAFTRKGDFWAGLALAGLGIYIVSQALSWTYLSEEGPGAGFFPIWYGVAMVVFSLLLVAGAVLKNDARANSAPFAWGEIRRAMTCWLALAVCVGLLKLVGFIIAFGLLTWFIVAIMFRRPQRIALSLAAGGAVGFYALFTWGLDLPLPAGLLF